MNWRTKNTRILISVVFALSGMYATHAADFQSQLQDLHEKAESARGEKDFEAVERTRLERLDLISRSEETGVWRSGVKAIDDARRLVTKMKYADACKLLIDAWRECEEASQDGSPVFGDVALELFLSVQAAKAVHDPFETVPDELLRSAIKKAVRNDPCQVESLAADAFLTTPNPSESFEKMENRPSLRSRNQQLLALSYPKGERSPLRSWHPVVEYLKAENYAFVLKDLQYLPRFLDPRSRVTGRDKYGERFCVVLSGGLLVNGLDPSDARSRGRLFVDIIGDDAQWIRMRPELVSVKRAAARDEAEEWSIDEERSLKSVSEKVKKAKDILEAFAGRRLDETTEAFPAVVKQAIDLIKNGTWPKEWIDETGNVIPPPTPGTASPCVILKTASFGYKTYASNVPQYSEKATSSSEVCEKLAADVLAWSTLASQSDTALSPGGAATDLVTQKTACKSRLDYLDKLTNAAASAVWLDTIVSQEAGSGDNDKLKKDDLGGPGALAGFGNAGDADLLNASDAISQIKLKAECDALRLVTVLRETLVEFQSQMAGLAPSAEGAVQANVPERLAAQELMTSATALRSVLGANAENVTSIKRLDLQCIREVARCVQSMQRTISALGRPEHKDLEISVNTALGLAEQIVGSQADEVDLRQAFGEAVVLREWTKNGLKWSFYDVPRGVLLENLARWIDRLPRFAAACSELDKVESDSDQPVVVVLDPVSLVSDNVFVSKDLRTLAMDRDKPSETEYAIALVRYPEDQPNAGPACDVDEKSRSVMWQEDAGGRLRQPIRVDVEQRELVVEFPGVDGHIPLVADANPYKDVRYIKDGRSTKVESARTNVDRLFYMIADNGQELNDSQVNYSIAQWVDLDRNIINVFLPDVLMCAPSIPAWLKYRESLLRETPADGLIWSVPRRAFPDGNGVWDSYQK